MPVFDPAIFDPAIFDAGPQVFEAPQVDVRVAWRPEQYNAVTNPGFETNTTGWSVSAGINGAGTSITRITTDFHSGVACASLVCPATADTGVNYDFGAMSFFAATTYASVYRFVVWLKSVSGTTQATIIVGSEGTSSDRASRDITLTTEWAPYFIDWLPSATRTDVQLAIVNAVAVAMTARIDDVAVYLRDAMTQVENGYFLTNTTGWSVGAGINAAGTSITRQTSGGFYTAVCGRLVTTGTSGSGVNFDLGSKTFKQGRTYRVRVYLKSISGTTSARIRFGSLGTGADRGDSSPTITTTWAKYTVDWTPSADRTDVELAVSNGTAAIMTADIDGVEIYEALDDITADAFGENGGQNLAFGRGSNFDGSGDSVGWANLRVVNAMSGGKYTPENSSGSLYGLLEAGKRVLIRAISTGAVYGVFAGQIDRLIPYPMQMAADIMCRDALDEFSRISIHLAETADGSLDARTAAYQAAYLPTPFYSTGSGPAERTSIYYGTDEISLLDYLRNLNMATGTVHWIQPNALASMPWSIYSRDRSVHSDATTPSETWNDDMGRIDGFDVTREALINRQRVGFAAYGGYEELTNETVLEWFYDEAFDYLDGLGDHQPHVVGIAEGSAPEVTMPVPIPANGKRIFEFQFSTPIALSHTITGAYTGLTFSAESESTRFRLIVQGGAADTTWPSGSLGHFEIRGRALKEAPINFADEKDEESIWSKGERQGNPIDSRYIQHPAHASGLAKWFVWRYGSARARPTIVRENKFTSQLARTVGDRVTVTLARMSVSSKVFVIKSLTTTLTEGGHRWVTTYEMERLPDPPSGGWFKLDTSALDGSAVLAY